MIILTAFLAILLTSIAEIFTLSQDFHRGEFPWWADALGIPLTGITFITLLLFVWAGLHLSFLKGNFSLAVPLSKAISRDINLFRPFLLENSQVNPGCYGVSLLIGFPESFQKKVLLLPTRNMRTVDGLF